MVCYLLQSKDNFCELDFEKEVLAVAETSAVPVLVPRLIDGQLRIKVTALEEFENLKLTPGFSPLCHGGCQYLFGYEPNSLEETVGIAVSSWSIDPLAAKPRVLYPFASTFYKAFGRGYGDRSRAKCFGINSYLGKRLSSRPHPTAFVADEDIPRHQYRNASSDNHQLIQPILLKRVNELNTNAEALAWKINRAAMNLGGKGCIVRGLVTCGIPTSSAASPIAFMNTEHVDTCDELSEKVRGDLEIVPTTPYEERLGCFQGNSVPTTVAYQFVYAAGARDVLYQQYFSLDGLKLAVPIKDGIVHSFLGGSFSHRTCICTGKHQASKKVRVSNFDGSFVLFAWGRTGGARDVVEVSLNPREARTNGNVRRASL